MKQRCWKELKNQLCPPQRWVKDSQHTKCQCCAKQFLLLVRRRHHCRFCGNLFCADCSDYFINGNYIGQTKEKYIRHCEFCHKKIQKFIRQWTKMPQIYQQKNAQKNSHIQEDLTEDDQDQKQNDFNQNKIFQQSEKTTSQFNQILSQHQTKILNQSTQALCDKFGLDKQIWKQKIKDLAQKAANQTKMQVLVSEGTSDIGMDIARRVRVKTILTQGNKGVQALVKGIVLQKNTATKSMKSHLSQPNVLIVQNSIDLDSLASFIKFQELIKNDKAIMKKILQKIIKLNPDIIFVQNNVHVYVLQYLQSKEIVVVNKLKQKQLEMIKQVTGIKKTIKKLWMLQKYKHQCIMGKCDKIYFKNVREGQMLMFIQAAQMGIRTILIGQQHQNQTNNLKKSVQILMRMARQLNLQKNFILVEKQIKERISKKQYVLPIIEDFQPQIYQDIQTFLINQQICFSKICYSPIKLSQSSKIFQEYSHRVGKASYKQICGKIQFLTKKIYSNSDCTLGAYILMAAANFQRPCKKCQNNHKQQYYLKDFVITIETEKKSSTVAKTASNNSFNQITNQQEQFTLQKLKNHLNKQKQLIVISTYAQCQLCGNTVGFQNVKVGKLFLSNSFHHILHILVVSYRMTMKNLQQLFKDDQSVNSGTQTNRRMRRKLSIDKCSHSILTRVYQYTGIQIKISIQPMKICYTDYIDLTRKQSIQYMKIKQNRFTRAMYQYEISQKMKLLQKLSIQLSTLPFPSMSASVSMSPGPKIMTYFQHSMKLKDILEKCRTELKQIQTKSLEQLQKPKHDWTILTRRILKVESILQMTFLIIDQIQRNLRKKKLQDNTGNQTSILVQNLQSSHSGQKEEADMSILMSHNHSVVAPQTYLDEQTKQYLRKKSIKVFPRVQGTYFHFHTANINDPVSLLACGINSSQFRRICEQEINTNPIQFTFRMNVYKRLKTDWSLRSQTDKIYTQVVGQIGQKMQAIDITVYYPKQFENFRIKQGINNQLYTRGLCTCKSWDSSGGKSNSLFAKAENDLLVVKVINQKEFDQFLKFAKDYIQYMKSSKSVGRDTLLAKIFGIYEVTAKNKTYKCIVMQNIFFGLQNINKVYDLKGSQVNRLNMPEGNKSSTGQDTNFKIDKQGQPYVLKAHEYDKIIKVLEDDSAFLKQHAVIDYSLLVIESKNSLRLGIIDYMRPYQLMQKIQTFYKEFKSGRDPTVIPPNSYAQRFIVAMKKYFLKVQ